MIIKLLAAPCVTLFVLDLHGQRKVCRHCAVFHLPRGVSSRVYKDIMAKENTWKETFLLLRTSPNSFLYPLLQQKNESCCSLLLLQVITT